MKPAKRRGDDFPHLNTLGILGGMSPESTADYYRRINLGVRQELGGHHSAPLLIFSADLARVFHWLAEEDDARLADYLTRAAKGLERAGAQAVLMACNTAHKVAPQIEDALGVPFMHIADSLGGAVGRAGITKLGLLGSQVTTESAFYRDRLHQAHGIVPLVPGRADRQEVDRIIRDELSFHDIRPSSRQMLERIAQRLRQQGAEAVALACTEIVLLVDGPELAGLPVFDTTTLHADDGVSYILGQRGAGAAATAPALVTAG